MADETKTYKPKRYKLGKGAGLELPQMRGIVVTNANINNSAVLELLKVRCPEVFHNGQVVEA